MKILKNKFKTIALIILGILIGSNITVYATGYFAKDMIYKKGDTEINVEDALNELYTLKNIQLVEIQGATNNSLSNIYDNRIHLYQYGKYCHLVVDLSPANQGESYKIINDSKYFPKTPVTLSGMGGDYGVVTYTLKTDGCVEIVKQYKHNIWASINVWYECN